MSEILRKAIAATAKTVESCQSSVTAIESQIAAATSRLKKSEAYRERFALDAQLGKPDAIADVAKASAEAAGALGDLSDLGRALSEARSRLAEAEREAQNARRHLAQFEVKLLQRKRIDIAGEIDEAGRHLERLCRKYDELGAEIMNMPDALPPMHGVSDLEAAIGARRLRAALPAFFWKLFPGALYDEQKPETLAVTEARHWNLAPIRF